MALWYTKVICGFLLVMMEMQGIIKKFFWLLSI